MNVYLVSGEGFSRVVEAPSFGDAVRFWAAAAVEEWGPEEEDGSGWSLASEPDEVHLISDEPVVRAPS